MVNFAHGFLMSHPFKDLGVSLDLIKGIEELQIHKPTEVQEGAIPYLIEKGNDFIAQAQTGTGKTAAFGLPLLMKINPKSDDIQALVLAPTRELAKQIGKQLFRFTKYTEKMFVEVLCGGDKMEKQIASLRRPTQIIVATPGRLVDLLKKRALRLDSVKYFVLDEADEMLSMGFKKQLDEIFELTEQKKSTWLFSATFPDSINELIRKRMDTSAKHLVIDQKHVVNRDISHRYILLDRAEKDDYIARFLKNERGARGLIFCRTKAGANTLCYKLKERGYPVDVIQGDLTQKERDKVMRAFKKGRLECLIATDVAARGIDVDNLAFVMHHQLPDQTEYYTHRSGRTARAGKKGVSIVLAEPKDRKRIKALESELGLYFDQIR